MGDIEALAVVVPLEWVQHDDRAKLAVERVGVDRGGLGWTEHDENTVVLQRPDEVSDGPGRYVPECPDVLSSSLRRIAFSVVNGGRERRDIDLGKLDVSLQSRGNINSQLAVGECLVTSELASGAKRPEVR